MPTTPGPDTPGAGWFPDPNGSGGNRWWTGTAWGPQMQPVSEPSWRWFLTRRVVLVGAAAVFAGLFIVGLMTDSPDDPEERDRRSALIGEEVGRDLNLSWRTYFAPAPPDISAECSREADDAIVADADIVGEDFLAACVDAYREGYEGYEP